MEKVTISREEYENLIAEKERLSQQVDFLLEQMKLARHRQFGSSSEKSEYDSAQLNLFNEAEVCAGETISELEMTEIKKHYRKKYRQNRERLPADLPVEIIEQPCRPRNRTAPNAAILCMSWARKSVKN